MAKVNGQTIKWLAANTKKVIPSIVFLTAIGAAISFISVKFAVASMHLIDAAVGRADSGFSSSIIRIAILIIVQLILEIVYTVCDIRVRASFKNRLQRNLFNIVLTRDYMGIGKIHSGEIMNRLTSDVELIDTNIVDVVPGIVMLVCSVVFSFIEMFRLDASLSLICLALGPLVMVSAMLYGKKMKGLYKKCRQSDGKTRSFMQECIQNIIAIKAFCSEKKASAITGELQRENYRLTMKSGYISVIVNVLYFLAMTVAYYFAVAWCAYKIKLGIMTVGALTAIVQLVGSIQTPFKSIAGMIPKFYSTCASAERIMEFEQIDCDFENGDLLDSFEFDSINAKNISFSYDGENILENADFEIKSGEIAVIHGLSGIGKSTFFKILLGILKIDGGSVAVKTKNEDVEVGAKTRNLFSYVPQGNMIISGTIMENITFFDENSDIEKAKEAAKVACIWDYISTLDDGLNTKIGENGLGLSEGQIQRIAIARAFYRNAPVILLDEATSALDDETELNILKNIKELKDRTCMIITHRPRAFEICDRKIRLNDKKFICE